MAKKKKARTGGIPKPVSPVEQAEIVSAYFTGTPVFGGIDTQALTPDLLRGKAKKTYEQLVEEEKLGETFTLEEAIDAGLKPSDFLGRIRNEFLSRQIALNRGKWSSPEFIRRTLHGSAPEELSSFFQEYHNTIQRKALDLTARGTDLFEAGLNIAAGIDTSNEVANAFADAAERELQFQLGASGLPATGGSAFARTTAGIEARQRFGQALAGLGAQAASGGSALLGSVNPLATGAGALQANQQFFQQRLGTYTLTQQRRLAERAFDILNNPVDILTRSFAAQAPELVGDLGAALIGGAFGRPSPPPQKRGFFSRMFGG